MSHDVNLFVIPGQELLRFRGIDLRSLPVTVVSTPRHASALLVLSPLPDELAQAAAVVFQQIPRPRAILQIGTAPINQLPDPDVIASPDQADLERAVDELQTIIVRGCWPIEPVHESDTPDDDHSGHNHSEHHEHKGHEHMDHEEHGGHEHMDHGDHSGHDHMHHGHDHGDGFMSMIAMTQDLPRSADGLQMDWIETAFGPIFPGLPAGLNLTLTLDGDTVATAELVPGAATRGSTSALPTSLGQFSTSIDDLDQLAPGVYGLLARRATGCAETSAREARHLEICRAISHLGWLASFAELIGYAVLADEATDLQLALVQGAAPETAHDRAVSIRKRVRRSWLLQHRLRGLGKLSDKHAPLLSGPNARAMGIPADARTGEPVYQPISFTPVTGKGGDAWARLNLRVDEIVQSLDLASKFTEDLSNTLGPPASGEPGSARLETPRGLAQLTLARENDTIMHAELATPSAAHARLIPQVAEGRELSDALIAVASLDLSPWEIDQ